MIWKRMKSGLFYIILSMLIFSFLNTSNLLFVRLAAAEGNSAEWFFSGWQYRKEHNITQEQMGGVLRFYDLSAPWATISGNPPARHAFQPVHNSAILEVDKLVDGEIQKYLAYDSDPVGSQIRLYYTNDSADVWTPFSGNPILGPSSDHYRWPSTAYVDGTFHMFLTDRTDGNLERWTSIDGIHFALDENVKTGGNEYKNPYVWCNPNDNKWYLYSHDASSGTEYFKVRNAINIEDLNAASDVIVVSRTVPFGAPTMTFYDGKYWLLGEVLEGGIWKVAAYYSNTSPSSGFKECFNSPILSDDECCPVLLLNPNLTQAYLFTCKDSRAWYVDSREVYLNSTIDLAASDLANYQIKIKTFYGNGLDNGENVYFNSCSKADFGDIRFTWFNSSSKAEIPCSYWIEEFNLNDAASFWVKIPEITGGSNTAIYVYYGKNDASTTSNGEATFDFFDDFNGTLSKWTAVGGTWKTENGELSAETNAFGQRIRANNFSFGNHSIHVKLKWISGTYFEHGPYVRGQLPNEASSGYITILSTWTYDNRHRISKMSSGLETTYASQGTTNPSKNIWYNFIFELYGNVLKSSISPTYTAKISGTDSSFRNGTLSLFSWSGSSEHVHYDDLFVCKYVDPEPKHGSWGSEETSNSVTIDQAIATDNRVDVDSFQTISFHVVWTSNGSDIIGGSIWVNNTEYYTNDTGWISISASESTAKKDTWIVTAVNCSGVTTYLQTAQPPSVVWDRINITDGGITKNPAIIGETTTIWFKAIYEFDQQAFTGARGKLHVNDLEMAWSALDNRWEYNYGISTLGSEVFIISGVKDNTYNLTTINNLAGPQTLSVWSLPFSIISNSTISEMTFNSTGKTLSFTVSGTSGTTGYTNVTIAKTLITNINELVVYVDGKQTDCTITSTNEFWSLIFVYHHSTHKVLINLNSSHEDSLIRTTHGKTITLAWPTMAILLAAFLFITKRKRR